MTDALHHRLQKELEQRRQDHLLRVLEVQNTFRLNLCNNDYFQLRCHPDVVACARDSLDRYGAGSGASPLLSGFLPCHESLIRQLMAWKNKSAGVLFNTGFMANQAILKNLPGSRDLVLVDRLAHHSVAQALLSGKAPFRRYRHLDLDHLEELLSQYKRKVDTIFVITESVFSMDGDYPDLNRLARLKSEYGFLWILDEAHGTGIFGATGGGLAEEMGVLKDVDLLVGTLGKVLASMGAYILSDSKTLIDYLINYSGEFIYSTYLAPALVGAASAALEIVKKSDEQRKHIRKMAARLRAGLTQEGWQTNEFDSQIIPLILKDPKYTIEIRNKLLDHGILTGAVRPPTVPQNSSRIRFSLHSGVSEQDVEDILRVLSQWKSQ